MASADWMRFVIPCPPSTPPASRRYFGRQRGSTLYSSMAGTYTVFARKLIPGTQRDSLHVLDGLLANQTGIQPEMVSTDTAWRLRDRLRPGLGAGLPVGTAAGRACPASGCGASTARPTTGR